MKKKVSILVALVMLLTTFAVPISAYGKEQKVQAYAFHEHYFISTEDYEEDEIRLDMNESIQLYLNYATEVDNQQFNSLSEVSPDWYWESANPDIVKISEDGMASYVSEGIAKILVKDEKGMEQASINLLAGDVEAKKYSITQVNGEFQKNPYEYNGDDEEMLYAQIDVGETINLKIDSNRDSDQIVQTDWEWDSSDYDEEMIQLGEPTEEGIAIKGIADGVVTIYAYNNYYDGYTSDITLYVGDACSYYVADMEEKATGWRYMDIGESLTLGVLTVPTKNVAAAKWEWYIEENVTYPGEVSLKNNTLTALTQGDVSIGAAHPDIVGERNSLELQIGYDDYWGADADYRLYPQNRTAKLRDWYGLEDPGVKVTVPVTITVNADYCFRPGTYTVTAIGKGAICNSRTKSVVVPNTVTTIEDYGVGYERVYDDNGDDRYLKIAGFTIYGYSDTSAAAKYAAKNGIKYVNLASNPVVKKNAAITAKSFIKTYGNKPFSLGAKANSGGKLTYKSSSTKVATVSSTGRVTLKGPGKATITITAAATANYNAASKNVTITVKPKKVAGLKVKKGKKRMTVSWKRDKKVTGYQITYAQNKKFKKGKKTITISKNKTIKRTVKKLKARKTYYVKVRAYKNIGKTKIYGAYSGTKKVKVR